MIKACTHKKTSDFYCHFILTVADIIKEVFEDSADKKN